MEKYLIHWYPTCSGGLCDRILGLASTFCIANLLKMKVLIKWDNCDLSSGFNINNKYNWYKNPCTYTEKILNNFELIEYFKTKNIIEDWKDNNILMWSNINLFNYLRENNFIKDLIKDDYILNFQQSINKILNEVFIINDKIKVDNVYDIGIHIRTGDKQIYNKENEEFYREYITNIFKKIKEDIKDTNKTIFISSDCLLTYRIAKEYLNNIYYNEGCIIHTAEENKINEEGLHKVLKDLLTLCNCNELYIGWNSNFSRISALYNTKRKFICYELNNNSDIFNNIDSETLFSYFSWGKYT